MITHFGMSPIQRHMLKAGASPGPPPPPGALRTRLVVRDEKGLDCEAAKYPLLALRGMACSLWVTHLEAGSVQLVVAGETTRAAEVLSARFRAGAELTLTATGEDAERALDACREMLACPAENRRGLYRMRYRGGTA